MLKKYIKNERLRNAVEWLLFIIIALALGLFIRSFVFRTASIFGDSMEPTLSHNDIVIINKLIYRFSKPKRGDIVAFPYKNNPAKHYVKRVIGLPGDVIDIRDEKIYINDEILDDGFQNTDYYIVRGNQEYPLTVPKGSYFVLGDNRNKSEDSRYTEVGCVPLADIDGKASMCVYPFSKFNFIK